MPYCSMMLGDLGAEIIRVERPGVGDENRHWGPSWAGGQSASCFCTDRGKGSMPIDRVLAAPQVLAREMVLEMEHPRTGKYKVVGSPMKVSETPVQYRIPPPLLGEHTGRSSQRYLRK